MRSSYIENGFGEKLQLITEAYKPVLTVELGVLDGYSLMHIAKGVKWVKEHLGVPGKIDAYDLWEAYPYKHGDINAVQKLLIDNGLQEYVTLHRGDAYEVHNLYPNRSVYLLHIDISNTGETVKKIMENWNQKMVHNGVILFEGGSDERDNIEWMKLYNKPSIRKEINENPIIDQFYVVGCYEQFPSMTLLYKKYDEEHMP